MTKLNSEQKINAVIRYQDGNESIYDIAVSFGTNYEVVRMWINCLYNRFKTNLFICFENVREILSTINKRR